MKNDKENIEAKEKQQNKEEETTDQILKNLDFDKEFEKLKEVWNRPLNLPRDVDWDKVFKVKHPKYSYYYRHGTTEVKHKKLFISEYFLNFIW
ncbi:MAG: hypothetical protein IJ759_07815 [Bacteroidales bacterium]|nr:hypothetical protein [Bacteroidales bacterium]